VSVPASLASGERLPAVLQRFALTSAPSRLSGDSIDEQAHRSYAERRAARLEGRAVDVRVGGHKGDPRWINLS
jgi:hypothetical protein